MKSYREIADSVFARREQYVIAQRKKKQLVTRVTASVGSVALVSLASVALFKSDAFRETPPISDGGATTTTTHIPTEGEATTTTTTTVNTTAPAPTTTDGGIVTPPTTSVPVPSQTTTPSKTQSPTVTTTPSKTQPTATTPSKTEPSKTNPTQPTASQTQPTATQTQPTQTTTQPTAPPQVNNYVVAETPLSTEGDPGPPYAISAKIPAQCNIAEETVTITLSYGPFKGLMLKPNASGWVLVKIETDDGKEMILKKIDVWEFVSSEYFVYEVWGEDGWPIAYNYSHTEIVQLPLSLCSKEKGRIWITVEDDSDILGTGVPFDYIRTETSITFYAVK